MSPNNSLLLVCTFLSIQVLAQPAAKKYTFKEIGWTMELPADFTAFPSADSSVHIGPGPAGNPSISKRLITAMSGNNTVVLMLSSCNSQDNNKDDGFNSANKQSYQFSAKNMGQGVQIDTATTTVTIDGVPFKRFRMTTRKNNLIQNNYVAMATCYKGYRIVVTLCYYSKKAALQLESMLDQSKFSR